VPDPNETINLYRKHKYMKYFKAFLLIIFLASCSNGTQMELENTKETVAKLTALKAKEKFIGGESIFYSGAPSEEIRLIAQTSTNKLIQRLIDTPDKELNKSYIMSLFVESATPLQNMDSEELERGLEYMEEVMDIYGIESSDGLLNNLRYGFDPEDG
jgi:hypothetical protein